MRMCHICLRDRRPESVDNEAWSLRSMAQLRCMHNQYGQLGRELYQEIDNELFAVFLFYSALIAHGQRKSHNPNSILA
jgi:hypothetical protein